MRAQPPPEWTRGLPPRGKSTARLERKTKENQRRSRPRGAAEGPALSRVPVPVPSSTAWAAVELGPATTSLRSIAFSPPHVGSLFIFIFFFSSMGYKIGLLLLWPTSPALWLI